MSHSTPTTPTSPTTPGRRTAVRRNRVNLTTVLAAVLPVICLLGLFLVRPDAAPGTTHPPTRTTLTTSTLVCPTALPDAAGVALSSAAQGVKGKVTVGLGKDTQDADIASGQVTTLDDAGPVAVSGADETAPGLVAARSGGKEPAAAGCLPPIPDEWFTGVGAGAGHTSVLELTNPDSGTAIADVTVLGPAGVVDAPRLRGVSVEGGSTVQLDLGRLVPGRADLALHVVTARGRLGATLLDRYDRIGAGRLTRDWLPGQVEPATSNLLMGLAPGTGRRTLVIANPGADEVRADVKIVDQDSVFAPKGVPEVRIAPESVRRVTVSEVVAQAIVDGAIGLEVTATGPVTATMRSQVAGDLSHAVAGAPVSAPSTVLLPESTATGAKASKKTLVVAGATHAGTVTVVSRSATGQQLDSTTVEITPDRGVAVKLPADAVLVTVTPARTPVTGAVLVDSAAGAAVVPLTVPVESGLVPAVHPGLP